jgi:hypothetical protein
MVGQHLDACLTKRTHLNTSCRFMSSDFPRIYTRGMRADAPKTHGAFMYSFYHLPVHKKISSVSVPDHPELTVLIT